MDFTQYATPKLLKYGIQYYILGRQSFFLEYFPIAGNMFHHAFEMLLKAPLSNRLSVKEMKGKTLGHKLDAIWMRYKCLYPHSDLDAFDSMINELNKWEKVRYPDELPNYNTSMSWFLYKETKPVQITTSVPVEAEHLHILALEEMDEFFEFLILSFSVSLDWIKDHIITINGMQIYHAENRHIFL